jgi:Ca2+/Na+ antiporter
MLFVEPSILSTPQLIVTAILYGFVIYSASKMIADGSELLLLVPRLSSIVGSVVLPLLGAVPDAIMILFAGLGSGDQISVGMGTLAGSSIMLLTLPWFASVLGGKVPLLNKRLIYKKAVATERMGVSIEETTKKTSHFMLATSCIYIIIQYLNVNSRNFEVIPILLCSVCLISYLSYQWISSQETETVVREIISESQVLAIRSGTISFRGLADSLVKSGGLHEKLVSKKLDTSLESVLQHFFQIYDSDKDSKISLDEFKSLIRDLREIVDETEARKLFDSADLDRSGQIDFSEFCLLISEYIENCVTPASPVSNNSVASNDSVCIPDELAHLPPDIQQRRIKLKAMQLLLFGTILVFLFSDPAVDVLSEFGARTGVDPFYFSFILSPLASNASEIIASYEYAKKKTKKSVTISFVSLQGAAIMNNTLGLAVMLIMIYINGLPWTFFAESAAVFFVQVCLWILINTKNFHSVTTAWVVLGLYPLSLGIVYVLKNFR